jgi:Kef-type K+ transport system membrane component KefB/nucleotide-binding universal stress UspA family protein
MRIILGPSLLGWLWPEAMATLFPATSLPALHLLSQVGLLLFMFLIGLELDPRLLQGRTHSSVLIGYTSIIVPFALGAAAAWWLWRLYSSPDAPLVPFLLFLGAAMSATAFPILARILSEHHLLASRMGAITIACAAVDDVTAWCILAFVVSVARAQAITDALWTTGLAVAFILMMMLVVRPFLRRVGARVASPEGLTPAMLAILLLLLIASSTITEIIGVHELFGAFLFGAILPKEGRLAETLADKLETVAVVLLLPLFFAYSGLRTEIGLISQPQEWLITGALILLATAGKLGGSAVAARLTGLRWREASAIGILLNTRGLMVLIVLNIGMDLGVVSPTVFTMLVIMALVTTFATSPLLRWVYPDHERARDRLVEPAEVMPGEPAPFTVLMCVTDGTSGPGMATVASGLLGKRDEPARLFALHLWHPSDRPSVERRRSSSDDQGGPLAALVDRARALMLDVRVLGFVSAEPAADICRTAEAKQASLVLLGSHKPLLLEGRLGGTVSDVVASARMPVGVLVDRGLTKVQRVLVAFAGGPEDLAALRLAQRFGHAPGAQITVLHVVSPGDAAHTGRGRTQLDQVFAEPELDSSSIRVYIVAHASPPEAVLDEARKGYDLVVLGMNARWGLRTGTISLRRQRVLSESPVSVLAVHPPLAAKAEQAHSQYLARLAGSPSV